MPLQKRGQLNSGHDDVRRLGGSCRYLGLYETFFFDERLPVFCALALMILQIFNASTAYGMRRAACRLLG